MEWTLAVASALTLILILYLTLALLFPEKFA